jgi:hypothetical protein
MRHNKLWVVSTLSIVKEVMHFVLKCSLKHYQPMIWHVISFVYMVMKRTRRMDVAIRMVAYVHAHDLRNSALSLS